MIRNLDIGRNDVVNSLRDAISVVSMNVLPVFGQTRLSVITKQQEQEQDLWTVSSSYYSSSIQKSLIEYGV